MIRFWMTVIGCARRTSLHGFGSMRPLTRKTRRMTPQRRLVAKRTIVSGKEMWRLHDQEWIFKTNRFGTEERWDRMWC